MKPKEFREIREKLDLTQKELAEILGLSVYMSVNHYESGFRNPSTLIATLMRIFDDWPEKKSLELREALKEKREPSKSSRRRKS